MPRVLMSANAAWNIVNFRAALVRALLADGHELIAAVPEDASAPDLRAMGVRVVPLAMASAGVSAARDLALFARFVAVMRRERPDVFLGWTIKPNTYGSFAATLSGAAAINNISGLGTAFIRRGWLNRIAKLLYRVALRRSATVFFQNADDRALFVAERLVRPDRTGLLPGSGIDPIAFDPAGYARPDDGIFRFLLVARLIADKGVFEYVEAARMLTARHPNVRFQVAGFLDVQNRTAIGRDALEAWQTEGVIDYLGATDDIRPALASADCVVLPSYREGTSRVLLEAAAMARPAITTDVPGCRDVVRDGRTGLLCRVRDAADLAAKMEAMVAITPEAREAMGRAARRDVIDRFSEATVIDRYRDAIARSIDSAARRGLK